MKKVFTFALAALMMCSLALVACGGNGGSTPSDVVKKAMDCAVNKDYKGMVQYIEGVDATATEKDIEEAAAFIEFAYSFNDGLASYEILGEEIAEDGQSATVKLNMTFGNGKTNETDGTVVKTDDGWKLSMK